VHAAVLENRAREVGIAVLDLDTATLTLDAFAEQGRSFAGLTLALAAAAAAGSRAAATTTATADGGPPRLASVAIVDSAASAAEHAATGGVARAVAAAGHPLVSLPRCLWDDGEGFLAVAVAAAFALVAGGTSSAEAAAAEGGGGAAHATKTHHPAGAGEVQEGEEESEEEAAAAAAAVHAHHRRSHYLAFGAAGALLQRAARDLSGAAGVAPRSLRVVYAPLNRQHTLLDPQTVDALELLPRAGGGSGGGWWQQRQQQHRQQQAPSRQQPQQQQQQSGGAQRYSSVYAFLNRCSTAAGARLLRTALLQPLTDAGSIGLRHGALEALLSRPQLAAVADEAVSRLPRHLDRVVGHLAIRPPAGAGAGGWGAAAAAAAARDPARRVAAAIDAAVGLRALLHALPPLAAALRFAHADSPLLAAAGRALSDARLARVLEKLEETLEEDAASVAAAGAGAAGGGSGGDEDGDGAGSDAAAAAAPASRGPFAARINVCFAVKAGGDGLLDVARATFCRLTEAVHALADGLRADLRRYAASTSSAAAAGSAPSSSRRAASAAAAAPPVSAAGFGVRYSARLGFFLQVPEAIARGQASIGGEGEGEDGGGALPRFLILGGGGGWSAGGGRARGGGGGGGGNGPAAQQSRQQQQQPPQRQQLLWCTTHELNALNARLRDAASDCLLHAERALQRLLERHVLPRMPQLLRAVDAASLADLLLAMARAVGESGGGRWVRPVLLPALAGGAAAGGALVVRAGRHPLYERGAGEAAHEAADAGLGGRRQARYGGGGGGGGAGGGGTAAAAGAAGGYVPNDVAAAATAAGSGSGGGGGASLHLIAGPNASGKTTYLRQVGVAAVLAQAGCFVPAEACAMRPFGRIVARFSAGRGGGGPGEGDGGGGGAGDDEDEDDAAVEAAAAAGGAGAGAGAGASHFVAEMHGLARALDAAAPNAAGGAVPQSAALVLLDEPGRATGTADGTALAWAAAERLLLASASSPASSACVAFVATHYRGLEGLARCYPRRCRVWRMRVDVEEGAFGGGGGRGGASSSAAAAGLRFRWRLEPASSSLPTGQGHVQQGQQRDQQGGDAALHYGVLLARATGALPEGVTARAFEIAAALEKSHRRRGHQGEEGEDDEEDEGGGGDNGAAQERRRQQQRQQRSHAIARALGGAAVVDAVGGQGADAAAAAAGGAWRRGVAALQRAAAAGGTAACV